MTDVETIIARVGGADAVAALTGVGAEAIRKWRQNRAIPAKHWPRLIEATGLGLEAFAQPSSASGPLTSPSTASQEPDMPQSPQALSADTPPAGATACLVLADGSVFWGRGFGAHSDQAQAVGELCFSTGLTGYQETLTDASFAGQIITFTFPHIGNVGTNDDDLEAAAIVARGLVVRADITAPSNWRSTQPLDAWLERARIPGIAGVDTRAITLRLRDGGPQTAVLCFPADGRFDLTALRADATGWPGLEGMDLAAEVSCRQSYHWTQARWDWDGAAVPKPRHKVVAVDYGAKRNILRSLVSVGCDVTVVPATATAEDILAHRPDGVFLSNGPGDPAATGAYAVPAIQGVIASGTPIFGICLGHQLLALALGAKTYKLKQGHRGANQPVKELATGRVEITSQNHGFAVDGASLPDGVEITHVSLFDGSNEGLRCTDRAVFSVQYHPEASPGPSDSAYLFEHFVALMDSKATAA